MNRTKKRDPRAFYFQQARLKRSSEIAEDYTEMIADLIKSQGKVRVCDLAEKMGVTHVNVVKTIKKLIRDGYLTPDTHPLIALTSKGQEMADYSKKKHIILTNLLIKLGVPEHIAAEDVEGIEHYISPETLKALEAHLESIEKRKIDLGSGYR